MATHQRWHLQSGQYLGEISALCFLHLPPQLSSFPFLLAGTGSQLLFYDLQSGTLVQSFSVFQGIRVHGISSFFCSSIDSSQSTLLVFRVTVFGEKRIKVFKLNVGVTLESHNPERVTVDLDLLHSLPKFNHWVLDVSFLKNCVSSSLEESHFVAIGCSDNSIRVWDFSSSSLILELLSPDRCLLYSMRLWGDSIETLHIASGTIFNEVLVWKVVPEQNALPLRTPKEDDLLSGSNPQQYRALHLHKLSGHEGSIFRILWSSCGSKLISVSDDRSARIWTVNGKQNYSDNHEENVSVDVLFGHNARVWDCCFSDNLIVTAGEDCTCRIWGLDGKQLGIIKEHIGRGVWRCLYDPTSFILVTAGFDSAIKVYQLQTTLDGRVEENGVAKECIEKADILTTCIPNSCDQVRLADSKSEYVRCLLFAHENRLYVSTNLGYLYHVMLSDSDNIRWSKLVRVSEVAPVICMDLLFKNMSEDSCDVNDWVALGDGKGNMTVVEVVNESCSPRVKCSFIWPAGRERQLLGTYWCKSLGNGYIFTADPAGVLRLWRLFDSSEDLKSTEKIYKPSLIAEFNSCFGTRVMCLDASVDEEVLLCGDLRGNLIVFPLTNRLLTDIYAPSGVKISPLSYFKGAHGITTVASISFAKLNAFQTEVCSTGGDGCICNFEYDIDRQSLEFTGMNQVKELSLIQHCCTNKNPDDYLGSSRYAAGFASSEFIIWNLTNEAKVVQIPCGGWRRPHSWYLGDVPERKFCFAYVKDEIIQVHRHWELERERRLFPQNLHLKFHGREMHSLCFICDDMLVKPVGKQIQEDKSSWIATGCEDGTVRLTRYTSGTESWSSSKLLGEHIAGSAVRSICGVPSIHIPASHLNTSSEKGNELNATSEEMNYPFLLISVGAKRVLTSWLLRNGNPDVSLVDQQNNKDGTTCRPSPGSSSSISFQWLSSDMPANSNSAGGKMKSVKRIVGTKECLTGSNFEEKSQSILNEKNDPDSKTYVEDMHADDWRYLAVTAFLVKCASFKLNICFIVVACSDATLTLRALVLPHRLWFDVALLVPLSSPVLALQHIVIPSCLPSEENKQTGNVYIVISGATDGSIAFWDLTDSVEAFIVQLSNLNLGKLIDCQKRPRTGRGSQGGRWLRSLRHGMTNKGSGSIVMTERNDGAGKSVCSDECNGFLESAKDRLDSSSEKCEMHPLIVLKNIHQSGVNCLHVSGVMEGQCSDGDFLFTLISGGDDQALQSHSFVFSLLEKVREYKIPMPNDINLLSKTKYASINGSRTFNQSPIEDCWIKIIYHDNISSAHSSAIKGVWTDGTWVFSTGLDQRIRCWSLGKKGKITEHSQIIISVPEPEALDARICDINCYQIAVAGRGMQIVEFVSSC